MKIIFFPFFCTQVKDFVKQTKTLTIFYIFFNSHCCFHFLGASRSDDCIPHSNVSGSSWKEVARFWKFSPKFSSLKVRKGILGICYFFTSPDRLVFRKWPMSTPNNASLVGRFIWTSLFHTMTLLKIHSTKGSSSTKLQRFPQTFEFVNLNWIVFGMCLCKGCVKLNKYDKSLKPNKMISLRTRRKYMKDLGVWRGRQNWIWITWAYSCAMVCRLECIFVNSGSYSNWMIAILWSI